MSRVVAAFVAVLVVVGGLASAEAHRHQKKHHRDDPIADKKHTRMRVCEEKTVKHGKHSRVKRTCKREAVFQGHNAAVATLRKDPLDKPSGDIWVKSENLGEEVKVHIYAADGGYDEDALAQLDEIFRCRRSNEVRAVDPRLYEQLSRIYDHFGGEPIVLVSGFRFRERDSSRHFHASAMDIKIKGVSINEIYSFAQTLDPGGMGIGIYPHSGFVHVDYRAPGEPSYRWTDYSYPGKDGKADAKHPPRKHHPRAHRPNA